MSTTGTPVVPGVGAGPVVRPGARTEAPADEAFVDRVGGPGDLEDDMLDGAASERLPNSRLSCQIKMRAEFDGLLVRIAPEQL